MKLYIDFDGVILDTINESFKLFEKIYGYSYYDNRPEYQKDSDIFYPTLDWFDLINNSAIINNSIENIKYLNNIYDTNILTHIVCEKEILAKTLFLNKNLPELKVIFLDRKILKSDKVNPYGNVLIDDFIPNLLPWKIKGGIPIHFSKSKIDNNYLNIYNLLDVPKTINEYEYKRKRNLI